MHIGIDCRLPYYDHGGISQYILNLLPALAELDRKNKYTIYHSRKDPKSYIPRSSQNFHRKELWTPSHHRYERLALGTEILLENIRGDGLDVLHSPDFIPPRFGPGHKVITVHDLNFIHYPEFLDPQSYRYYSGQISQAVKEANYISADSEHTRQDLINYLVVDPARIVTIPLAANPLYGQELDPDDVQNTLGKFGLPKGFILFVGTISVRKNIQVLIRAYKEIRLANQFDLPLVLVGRLGWQSDQIFNLILDLGLAEHVRHLADVTNSELRALYARAGVLVLPSHYEGFGLPALEAMHSKCPVIASDRSSLPEVVGTAGILLEPDDVPSWTDAIFRVVSDTSLRDELIAKGSEQVKKFNWQKTAQKTLDLYHRAVVDG